MKARILLVALAVTSLLGTTGASAKHPQGCNPLLPQIGLPIGGCPEPPDDDPQPLELSGCAYTAYANIDVPLIGNVIVPNTTPENFTTMGGASAVPSLSAPCPIYGAGYHGSNEQFGGATPPPAALTASLLRSTVDAEPMWVGGGYSLSSATVARLSLSVPTAGLTITADVVRAVAYCTKQAKGPGRDDIGPAGYGPATLAGLTISHPSLSGGSISIGALPPEDTWIPIPGIGGIMLRETWDLESPPYPGTPYKSFTENMIHVYLSGPVTGDIVVSHAHCDGYGLTGRPFKNPNQH